MALSKKGIAFTVGAMSMLFAGTWCTSAYEDVKNEIVAQKKKKEDEEAFIAEQKQKIEALALRYTSTKKDYVNYAYDANHVSEFLLNKKTESNSKRVFFTFDNVTSAETSDVIKQMLGEYNAKATFFYTGKYVEKNKESMTPIIQGLYNDGNSIGNRSYSDSYGYLFPGRRVNQNNFLEDYAKTDDVLRDILGDSFKTRAYRCPGGSMSWRGINDFYNEYSEKKSFAIIDWNVSPSANSSKSGSAIAQNAIKSSQDKDMVVLLVPNLSTDKMIEFLQETLAWYDSNGYLFNSLG